MRLALWLCLVLFTYAAHASSPPETILLTPSLAADLGFEVGIEPDSNFLTFAVKYPAKIGEYEEVSLTRFVLSDDDGEIIFATILEPQLESENWMLEEWPLFAIFDPAKAKATVSIEYTCTKFAECEHKWGAEYKIESVEEYAKSL